MKFELRYLELIEDLDRQTVVQGAFSPAFVKMVGAWTLTPPTDQSILISDGQYNLWSRIGTLRNIFEASIAPPEKRKCLNGLNFPNPLAALESGIPMTDIRAHIRTKGEPGCPTHLPADDIRFNLAATQGAFHFPHLDNCGDATWVHVLTGAKAWFVAEPKNGIDIASNDLWTSETLDLSDLDLSLWDVEGYLLFSGCKL